MDLSNDLISKFVKITNDNKKKNSESTVYGTVVEYNGGMYVRIDGSDLLTPVETTADFKPDERVTVMIKNHSATVTGNITSPATNEGAVTEKVTEAVEDVEGKVITEVEILIADRVSTKQLDAEVARIDNLIAGKATIEDLTATNAEITNLKADKADIEDLTATNARIDSLEANKADITYLDANFATIDELEATHAEVEILDAEVANINTLVNGNLTSDNILSFNITSQNTTMENAFVKDAMIDSVTANKIMSGTIDTNNVTIQSTDGSMLLQGTLLQMKDDNGKVRIQIGKDTGGNFTFILYDESGTGVLIDEEGIKSSDAIADGLIVDAKVADNANIAGSKLNIASVITEVNNDNSTTIKSNKIFLDEQGQSLEVAFNSLKTQVDTIQDVTIDGYLSSIVEQVQSNTTKIEANKEGINTLVAENVIRTEEINDLEGEIQQVNTTLSDKYTSLEQNLNGFKTTVNETYTTKSEFNNLQIGGTNLLPHSGNFKDSLHPWHSNGSNISIDTTVKYGNYNSIRIDNNNDQGMAYDGAIVLKPNTTYVYSITAVASGDVIGTASGPLHMHLYPAGTHDESYNNGTVHHESLIDWSHSGIGTLWGRSYLVFKTPATDTFYEMKPMIYLTGYQTIYIANLQVEEGTIPSAWSPAPEDVQGQIDATNNNLQNNYSTTSAMNSAIEQKANEITSSVSETYATKATVNDLNNNLSSNYSTTEAMNSAITQKANEITQTVSESYTTKSEFYNIEIGGTNLIQNGNFKGAIAGSTYMPAPWTFWGDEIHIYGAHGAPGYNHVGCVYIGCNLTDGRQAGMYSNGIHVSKVEKGANYMASFIFAIESNVKGATAQLEYMNDAGDQILHSQVLTTARVTDDVINGLHEHQYHIPFTMWTGDFSYVQIVFNHRGTNIPSNGYLMIVGNVQIEKGNKATDWSPAPEDVQGQIDATNNNLANNYSTTSQMNSAIQQKANEITSSVSESYTTKSEFNNLEVGGRNLLVGLYNDGLYDKVASGSKGEQFYYDIWAWGLNGLTEQNYVISFEARADSPINVTCYFYEPSNNTYAESSTGQKSNALDGEVEVTLTTEWKRYWVKWQHPGCEGHKHLLLGRNFTDTTAYIRRVKFEKGSKPTDWSPAPEDVQGQIDATNNNLANNYSTTTQMNSAIQQKANEITQTVSQTYITNYEAKKLADTTTTGLNKYLFERYQRDGFDYSARPTLNDLAGARLIESQLIDNPPGYTSALGDNYIGVLTFYLYYDYACTKTVTITTDDNGTVYLNNVGIYALNTCQPANVTFNMVKGLNRIDIIYAEGMGGDGVSWGGVDGYSAFGAYANVVTNEVASRTNELTLAMTQGNMLYTDPTFRNGYNGIEIYNNLGNGTVTNERITAIEGCPNTSGYCMKITTNGEAQPWLGGFYFGTYCRYNAVFITKITAKIPVGYRIGWASNHTGNNSEQKWLSSTDGTGDWYDYYCKVKCGDSGHISNTNFFYLDGPQASAENPVTWYVSYATVFDVTDSDERITNLTNNLANNYSTTSAMNSAIQQKANEITSSVSQTYTTKSETTAVQNQITTSRNLLMGSRDYNLGKWSIERATILDEWYNGTRVYMTNESWANIDYYISDLFDRGVIELFTPYTFSCYVMSTGSDYCPNIHFYGDGLPNSHGAFCGTATTSWQRISITIEWTSLDDRSYPIRFEADTPTPSGSYLKWACFQLERGRVATGWAPAPEDAQYGINDVYNNLTTNYSTTSAMNSAIQQKANEITSSVSQTYTTKTEFNNLEVGGTNLIYNGGFNRNLDSWNSNGGTHNVQVCHESPSGRMLCIAATVQGEGMYQFFTFHDSTYCTDYVVSFYAKTNVDGSQIYVSMERDPGTNSVFTLNGGWQKCVYKFRRSNPGTNAIVFYASGGGTRSIYIHSIKMEKGTVPSAWSPHPSEIENKVDNLSNNLTNNYSTTTQMNSAIQQKANEITSSVSQTYATKQSVTNLNNNLSAMNDTVVGNRKWLFEMYTNTQNVGTGSGTYPTLAHLANETLTSSRLVDGLPGSTSELGSNYLGVYTVYIYYESDYTWNGYIISDDESTTYLNGVAVCQAPSCTSTTFTMNFKKGVNKLQIIHGEGGGGDGVTLSALGPVKEYGAYPACVTAASSNHYASNSDIIQTVNDLTIKFAESGGYNLLQNGHANKGTSYWIDNGGGLSLQGGAAGGATGNFFSTSLPNGIYYYDWVQLLPNTHYVYQAKVWTYTTFEGNAWLPLHYWFSYDGVNNTGDGYTILDYQQSVPHASTWVQLYLHFVTGNNNIYFKPFISLLRSPIRSAKSICI